MNLAKPMVDQRDITFINNLVESDLPELNSKNFIRNVIWVVQYQILFNLNHLHQLQLRHLLWLHQQLQKYLRQVQQIWMLKELKEEDVVDLQQY